jgi:hypothetical protein
MAGSRIVDEPVEPVGDDIQDINEDVLSGEAAPAQSETKTFEIPDKFKGKSMEDIVKSYNELETRLGRQGSELGQLRQLTDQILTRELSTGKPKEEAISEEDFYENPETAVRKLVDNHPSTKRLNELEQRIARDSFSRKHPNWQNTATDEGFQKWVQGSQFRMRLWSEADQYNLDAADELFSAWAERQEMLAAAKEEDAKLAKQEKDAKLNAATTETGATSRTTGGKKYRRADLIRMRINDPAQYESREEEFMRAYAEGRVI